MDRKAEKLEELYRRNRDTPSNINQHLGTLRDLASECQVVCEFGVATGRSTTALLASKADRVYSWDPYPTEPALALARLVGGDHWHFTIGSSLTANLPYCCDMLFIDSVHTCRHLLLELEVHAHKVSKYLVFHDTVTFGKYAEASPGAGHCGTELGLLPAIETWTGRQEWKEKFHHTNNNGLLCLEHIDAP